MNGRPSRINIWWSAFPGGTACHDYRPAFQPKPSDRIQATKSEDFRSYFMLLRFQASGEECQLLTNEMTVNETYFFREDHHFDCLVHSILPVITKRKTKGEPIRIWCMPSSSGEEPYSIAITLLERWPGINDWDVEIIASDIDTGILNKARAGLYSERSIRNVPAHLLRKYFIKTGHDYQISRDLREAVEFTRANLAEPLDTRHYREFDVIFCRNLLIYFDDISRRTAADTFFDALHPGGFILLGHSESMSRISPIFNVRRFPEGIVYQKPVPIP
ncbi:MAG: protein-glutamate O-methyltransferase CheR [Verrucomicrobia bacterium]|nr:protein-glutamate O-methyltransferase CheR [Verrucomicrobiota bacterium]